MGLCWNNQHSIPRLLVLRSFALHSHFPQFFQHYLTLLYHAYFQLALLFNTIPTTALLCNLCFYLLCTLALRTFTLLHIALLMILYAFFKSLTIGSLSSTPLPCAPFPTTPSKLALLFLLLPLHFLKLKLLVQCALLHTEGAGLL